MIINKLTAEQYELLDILEDARLRPAKNEHGEPVDEVDPRLRVIETHLAELIADFDAAKAIVLAQMADELVARNTARLRYAQTVSAHAQAGHEASNVLVDLLENLMTENGIEKASNEQMRLEMVQMKPKESWAVVEIDEVPEKFWHIPNEKSISHNLVAMALEDPETEIPGIERTTVQGGPKLRRR